MTADISTEQSAATDRPERMGRPISRAARMLLLPIIAYRRWISPVLPARCRFYPSCSAYAIEAISTHGVLRGIGLAIWRLLRCQPFNRGGYDPVPPRREHGNRSQTAPWDGSTQGSPGSC